MSYYTRIYCDNCQFPEVYCQCERESEERKEPKAEEVKNKDSSEDFPDQLSIL